jgi:hypothetical protein
MTIEDVLAAWTMKPWHEFRSHFEEFALQICEVVGERVKESSTKIGFVRAHVGGDIFACLTASFFVTPDSKMRIHVHWGQPIEPTIDTEGFPLIRLRAVEYVEHGGCRVSRVPEKLLYPI